MPRDYRVYADDILEAIGKIKRFTSGFDLEAFAQDERTFDAVIRNLEVIGEAIKNIPDEVRIQHPAVEWKRSQVSEISSFMNISGLTSTLCGTLSRIS